MKMQTKICILLVTLCVIFTHSTSMGLPSQGKDAPTSDSQTTADKSPKDQTESTDANSQGQRTNDRKQYSSPYAYGAVPPQQQPLNQLITHFPGSTPTVTSFEPTTQPEPTCYALLDMQYPQFSDVCGTLPQVRYSLPNIFGHSERWQVAQVLSSVLSSSSPLTSNPDCLRSLRLLICPLLFPPCPTSVESTRVVPCQPFCRAVKSQCAAPTLDLLPCDFLPITSQFCPINTNPYKLQMSSFSQPMPYGSGMGQPTMPQTGFPLSPAQSAAQYTFQQESAPQQGLPQQNVPSAAMQQPAVNNFVPQARVQYFVPQQGAYSFYGPHTTGISSMLTQQGAYPFYGPQTTGVSSMLSQQGAYQSYGPQTTGASPSLTPQTGYPSMMPQTGAFPSYTGQAVPTAQTGRSYAQATPFQQQTYAHSYGANTMNPLLINVPYIQYPPGFSPRSATEEA